MIVNITLCTLQSNSISQFDEHLTAPLFGYQTVEDYHKDATNSDKLHKISIPYICLTATDDPFVPEKCMLNAIVQLLVKVVNGAY